ncbi:hypothetical protein H2198_002138 [Neophaeococcomyces mojaviensis]|uniref:Uncharacterized protein n=1 Tax=Neophaeococcomyces mojaviensis TaxID=3383035 RepID=A0ACC3AF53_9EURO|nr:hypothetical protein H2198_002138 [Knufia sp. JES_112]
MSTLKRSLEDEEVLRMRKEKHPKLGKESTMGADEEFEIEINLYDKPTRRQNNSTSGSESSGPTDHEEITVTDTACSDEDDRLQPEDHDEQDDDHEHMDDDEKSDSGCDEPDEKYNFCNERDWLEPINGLVYKTDNMSEKQIIGRCEAYLIRRSQIRDTFHLEIAEPFDIIGESFQMGFELFDRYGRLLAEHKDHPTKRGSGVWGSETDLGDILLIEKIQVQHEYRRLGLRTKTVEAILKAVRQKTENFFAVAGPASLTEEVEGRIKQASNSEKEAICQHENTIGRRFWRSIGFRRVGSTKFFAFAGDNHHKSHKLLAADDYDPPHPKESALNSDLECKLMFESFHKEDDETCGRLLREFVTQHNPNKMRWLTRDQNGDTLLHLSALQYMPATTRYLMDQNNQLSQARNLKGETPIEALMSHLERCRTYYQQSPGPIIKAVSDHFTGFQDNAVACMIILKHSASLPLTDLFDFMQLKFGCTCGGCASGFLSPRMRFALQAQAEKHSDFDEAFIRDEVSQGDYSELQYLPESVLRNLGTNKSMRQGYLKVCGHFATCLRKQLLPTEGNILEVLRDTNEWPPHTRNYLNRGGTIRAAASAVFLGALSADPWAGCNLLTKFTSDAIEKLPPCRNDREFAFVSGMLGYDRISPYVDCNIEGN